MNIVWGLLLRIGGFLLAVYCLTRKSSESVPTCYGSDPSPQDQAENDCYSCRLQTSCTNAERKRCV